MSLKAATVQPSKRAREHSAWRRVRPGRAWKGRPGKLGGPDHSSIILRCYGQPVLNLQRDRVSWCTRHPAKNKAPATEVGRQQGEPELRSMMVRKSEGRIVAMTSGNSWHLDPAEQRRPLLVRTSGGKHDRSKDFWYHVTGTVEGNGEINLWSSS